MSNTIKMSMVLLVFTLLMPWGPTLSYAWEHGDQGHSGSHYGGHSGGHEYRGSEARGYSNFRVGFNYAPYYYDPGYYYPYYYPNYYDTGVIVSSPDVGIPETVEQPSTAVVTTAPDYPTAEITPAPIAATGTDNEISINIPNAAGGYTNVLMKRSGKGFIGPQGEYYPEFPRVSVLRVIYGK